MLVNGGHGGQAEGAVEPVRGKQACIERIRARQAGAVYESDRYRTAAEGGWTLLLPVERWLIMTEILRTREGRSGLPQLVGRWARE